MAHLPSSTSALVAFYGDRQPPSFTAYVGRVQGLLAELPGFVPRPLPTVHTTVIGLDGSSPGSVEVHGFTRWLVEELTERPLRLRFGGYADTDHPITSRGRSLHERQLSTSGVDVVLVGWPVEQDRPVMRLDEIRRAAVRRGLPHRYPLPDPDAHVVIGRLDQPGSDLDDVRGEVADALVEVELTPATLACVVYTDPALPVASTEVLPVSKA